MLTHCQVVTPDSTKNPSLKKNCIFPEKNLDKAVNIAKIKVDQKQSTFLEVSNGLQNTLSLSRELLRLVLKL